MSDFLFSTEPGTAQTLRASLAHYLAPVASEIMERQGAWGSLAVVVAPHDPAEVLLEDGEALSVLVGEPVVRISPEPAGLSWSGRRRRAVHERLRHGEDAAWDRCLDGQYAALRFATADGSGVLVTDRFNFVPVFTASLRTGGIVFGTHVDAVARAAGRSADLDLVSAADLVATLTCTFPHTLYADVEQLAPGTVRRFSSTGWAGSGQTFWRPVEETRHRTLPEAADALRDAIAADVAVACEGVDRVGLLLSGGEDSRAVLGAVPAAERVRASIYADWESREVRVARRVAAAHGIPLTVAFRSPTHYMDGMEPAASLPGSNHLFMDVHGFGLHQRLGLGALPVVLGGLSSDSLLKAEYGAAGVRGPRPLVRLPELPMVRRDLLAEAGARRTAFRDRLAESRPRTADEWIHLWPFSMRKHGGNVDGNRRLFRNHEVFHSSAVLGIAAGAPPEWKRHRRLFHRAVQPFLARTWNIPHARRHYPYFGRGVNLALAPGLAAARGVRALATGELRARHGPWPKWSGVAGSAAAAGKWSRWPVNASPLRGIFEAGSDESVRRAVAGWYSLRQLILLQLSFITIDALRE